MILQENGLFIKITVNDEKCYATVFFSQSYKAIPLLLNFIYALRKYKALAYKENSEIELNIQRNTMFIYVYLYYNNCCYKTL